MAEALSIRRLSLAFGGIVALDEVDLAVEEGTISGLIGPNGAGKTSLLNCICRFYQPSGGEIRLGDVDVLRRAPHQLIGHGLARTFQQTELFNPLSVLDNVLVGAHVRKRPSMLGEALRLPGARRADRLQREWAHEALARLDLSAYAHMPAGALSLGMRKRAGLARAIAAQPRVLLLDEPAGGLNTTEKREMIPLLRRLRNELDLTILLIEHDMDMVMGLCDQVTVLDFGHRIASGPPRAIQRDPAVIAAYLGANFVPVGSGSSA